MAEDPISQFPATFSKQIVCLLDGHSGDHLFRENVDDLFRFVFQYEKIEIWIFTWLTTGWNQNWVIQNTHKKIDLSQVASCFMDMFG